MQSTLSQLIFINLDFSFQMESIFFFLTRFERWEARPIRIKQESISCHFWNFFSMMRPGFKPTTYLSQGKHSTTESPLR